MAPDIRKRLLAVLAADVAGYSRLIAADDEATVAMLDSARAVFRAHIAAHGGRVIDMAGDSVLAVFETAAGALAAALAVQRQLASPSAEAADLRMQFRIGIHLGDIIEKADGTVYGDGVNIAARLEGLAEPGAIAISQAVHGLVARAANATFEDIGEQSVKNIADPVRAYRVRPAAADGSAGRRWSVASTKPRGPTNLPETGSTLFGREADLDAVTMLVPEHRIVMLVGPGGIGKTRLALAIAGTVTDAFADGIFFVALAALADPTLLAGAVAQAVGVPLTGRKPAQDELIDTLSERTMLVVLDNCEHLVAAAGAFVAAALARAPRLHVLATSQEPLKVPEEHLYRLDALAVPASAELPSARAFGSVALFVERARALLPRFALTSDNVEDVVAICRALDGLPLAIELAAARVPLLGASGVRAHLHDRFRLLSKGTRVADRRHQTLHQALDWSHGLLSVDERAVLRRIGAFLGSFTLEAAQQVAAGDGIDAWTVLEQLDGLAEKSLLVVVDVEPRRYYLLESAREYSLEKLAQSGEREDVCDRHAAFFLRQAEGAEPLVTSADRQAPLKRLRDDLSNLRTALSWFTHARKDASSALRLASSLAWFAYFENLFQEGRSWLERALALPGAERPRAERAAALSGAARLAFYSGATSTAQALAGESVQIWRELGDVRGLAFALLHQGIAHCGAGQIEAGRDALADSLASFRSLDDPWGIALALSYLGVALSFIAGGDEEARRYFTEGRARFEALGDKWGKSTSSHYLGSIAMRSGDYATARQFTQEMLTDARALGDKYRISRTLHQLAEIDVAEQRLASAVTHLRESVTITHQQGRAGDASQQLRLFAHMASLLGAHESAALLAGAAARHAGADRTMPADDPKQHEELLLQLRQVLGEEDFRHAFDRGGTLSLGEAIALAASLQAVPC